MQADDALPLGTDVETIEVTVASALDRSSLEAELRMQARRGGLEIVDLRPCGDGLLGHWTCGFRSGPAGETIDDTRILGLLRALSGPIQWVAARKERRLDRPPELRSILGESAG